MKFLDVLCVLIPTEEQSAPTSPVGSRSPNFTRNISKTQATRYISPHCQTGRAWPISGMPKNKALSFSADCATFLGSGDFAGFPVGNDSEWCYRIDVAVIVTLGRFCRTSR